MAQQGGAGYDISLAASDANSSGTNSPLSLTDSSIGSGAGKLVQGMTLMEFVLVSSATGVLLALLLPKHS